MSLSTNASLVFEHFELDPSRRTLERDGSVVSLSPKAFDVLSYLVQNPARVITKDELLKAIWPSSFVEEGNLAQHISSLRKALGDRAGLIVTIPGRGYQFTARVQVPGEVRTQDEDHRHPHAPEQDVAQHPLPLDTGSQDEHLRERTHALVEETSTSILNQRGPFSSRLLWSLAVIIPAAAIIFYAVRRMAPPPKLQRVVVADFLNTTGDPDFDQSLKTALAAGLGQSPYIQLMSKGDEHSTLAHMEKVLDTPILGDIALEVCQRAGFEALLRSQISPDGPAYALTIEAIRCDTGASFATFHARASSKDRILDTLDSLANGVRHRLGERSDSIAQYGVPIREATTFSFEALQDYTRGAELGNAGRLPECIPFFRKAVNLDPKFAMAVASLGTAYNNLSDGEQASAYYRQAFDLAATVSEPEKLYIRSNYYLIAVRDLDAARAIFEEKTRIYPADHTGWIGLANVDTQLGDFPAAIAAGEHALKIGNPRQEVDYEVLARAYKRQNRFADAKRTIAAAQAQQIDAPALHRLLFDMALIEQDQQAMRKETAWSKDKPLPSGSLEEQAIAAADLGQARRSEELFQAAIDQGVKDVDLNYAQVMRDDEAGVELQTGRVQQAKTLLDQSELHSTGNKTFRTANFVVLAARAGDLAMAERYLALPMIYPNETVSLKLFRPEMNALIALHRGDPTAAIAALEVARPYELAHCEIIEIRGDAYLFLKDGLHAQTEFQKLIDHPALEDPTLPRTYIAHVNLARAYALQHKTAEARAEYERFFNLWADADPDAPILQQAHSEWAKL